MWHTFLLLSSGVSVQLVPESSDAVRASWQTMVLFKVRDLHLIPEWLFFFCSILYYWIIIVLQP